MPTITQMVYLENGRTPNQEQTRHRHGAPRSNTTAHLNKSHPAAWVGHQGRREPPRLSESPLLASAGSLWHKVPNRRKNRGKHPSTRHLQRAHNPKYTSRPSIDIFSQRILHARNNTNTFHISYTPSSLSTMKDKNELCKWCFFYGILLYIWLLFSHRMNWIHWHSCCTQTISFKRSYVQIGLSGCFFPLWCWVDFRNLLLHVPPFSLSRSNLRTHTHTHTHTHTKETNCSCNTGNDGFYKKQ